MIKQRLHLTFPELLIQEPVIYNFGKTFDVVTNIRRANVEDTVGWVILEVVGEPDRVAEGIKYLEQLGVHVSQIDGDVVAG
ncbi:MAG: NIL domain-containing protein [Actinomycetota bacterium]